MSELVDVKKLAKALVVCWSEDTTADPKNWHLGNPAWGNVLSLHW